MTETSQSREVAPGEPAFIRRLPEGVEYTRIKMIIWDLPSALTTLLWTSGPEADPLTTAFIGRSVRAIERRVRRTEESVEDRQHASLIRHQLVQLCLAALNSRPAPHPDRAITVEHVSPDQFRAEYRPDVSVPHVRITVHGKQNTRVRRGRGMPWKALETRTIVSEPAAWDASIPWIGPDHVDRTILELLKKHFSRVMSVRVARQWRSHYPPEGWRLITQYAVPALYEYLRPFYRVRPHRRIGREPGPGLYPVRLRQDITEIIRFELRHLAKKLTVSRVTAAIQRHTARRHSTRNASRRKRPKQ